MKPYWKTFWDRHVDQVSEDAPFHRVGRTLNQEAMDEGMFRDLVRRIIETLEIRENDEVLDLCCGNGLITVELAGNCRSVAAVDFSEALIEDLRKSAPENVTGIVSDALEISFEPGKFDRILLAAAIQHFSQPDIIQLFRNLSAWLRPAGILMLTDILDAPRIWNFYDREDREDLYFQNTMNGTPILGTWLDRTWLEKLARHAGFESATAFDQPDDYWYSHYRFDLVCRKAADPAARNDG